MNNTFKSINRKFSREAVLERFSFIEQRINNHILASDATFKDIQRETINLYDLADEKKNTLFAQMALEFHKFVQVETSKAFSKDLTSKQLRNKQRKQQRKRKLKRAPAQFPAHAVMTTKSTQ